MAGKRRPHPTYRRSELAPARAPIWPALIAIGAGCLVLLGLFAAIDALGL